jgi:hypothetical protein
MICGTNSIIYHDHLTVHLYDAIDGHGVSRAKMYSRVVLVGIWQTNKH